ncbi:MAG: hypothetical protein AAF716_08200 [Cyanobacteria bacterium P01_D01_bin.1]
MSWLALGLSVVSTFISVRNANYQAKISQLPAVSMYFRWDVPVPALEQEPYSTVQWRIENTGTGPAIVHSAKLFVPSTGESYNMTSGEAWDRLQSSLIKHFDAQIVGYSTDAVASGYAISEGAEWPLFEISVQNTDEELVSTAEVVILGLCHCSIASGECQTDDSDSDPDNVLIEDCPKKVNISELLQQS